MRLLLLRTTLLLLFAVSVFGKPVIADDICIRIFCDPKNTDKITNEKGHGRFFTARYEPEHTGSVGRGSYTITKSDYMEAKQACYFMHYLGYMKGKRDGEKIWGQDANSYEFYGTVLKISDQFWIARTENKCRDLEK